MVGLNRGAVEKRNPGDAQRAFRLANDLEGQGGRRHGIDETVEDAKALAQASERSEVRPERHLGKINARRHWTFGRNGLEFDCIRVVGSNALE